MSKKKNSDQKVVFVENPAVTPIPSQVKQEDWDTEILEGSETVSAESPEEPFLDEAAEDWKPDVSDDEADAQLKKISKAVQVQSDQDLETAEKIAKGISAELDPDELDAENERLIAEDIELEASLKKEAEQELQENEIDPELQNALPKVDENGELDLNELQSCIETLLFLSDKPLSLKKMKEHIGPDFKDELFLEALQAIQSRYGQVFHGFELLEIAGGYQFRTKAGRAPLARKLSKVQTQRLSRGAMECLAIVAYKQPVMKEDIDQIRGVDSSHFIRTLLEKKLVEIAGRSELPGRPMIYGTTPEFLQIFGLKDMSSMPSLREIEQMVPASSTQNPDEEDPKIRKLREMVEQMRTDSSHLAYQPQEDEKILADIKERVAGISTTTPYLEEQKALEKQAHEGPAQPELPPQVLMTPSQESPSADLT